MAVRVRVRVQPYVTAFEEVVVALFLKRHFVYPLRYFSISTESQSPQTRSHDTEFFFLDFFPAVLGRATAVRFKVTIAPSSSSLLSSPGESGELNIPCLFYLPIHIYSHTVYIDSIAVVGAKL